MLSQKTEFEVVSSRVTLTMQTKTVSETSIKLVAVIDFHFDLPQRASCPRGDNKTAPPSNPFIGLHTVQLIRVTFYETLREKSWQTA